MPGIEKQAIKFLCLVRIRRKFRKFKLWLGSRIPRTSNWKSQKCSWERSSSIITGGQSRYPGKYFLTILVNFQQFPVQLLKFFSRISIINWKKSSESNNQKSQKTHFQLTVWQNQHPIRALNHHFWTNQLLNFMPTNQLLQIHLQCNHKKCIVKH